MNNHGYDDANETMMEAMWDANVADRSIDKSSGRKLLSEMMGPAGGAVGGAAVAAAGLGSLPVAGALATVGMAGTVAYTGKRAIQQGSVREGAADTLKAGADLTQTGLEKVETLGRESYQTATDSGDAVDDGTRFD
ncbi:hypothetical protein I7X12_05675 [Halosimplex litoreum]|uniref:Uncharacterized protein n=1 Tax=Halosimplex litoreum TaxID=1198301 RepID=A0A7T3G0H5_9EURY|nr:hypothetical protein [Halosimplex litoreum]QPV64114.1 hypothetical protein I7X12_05675 [Halosimplex litoreum]